MDVALLLVSVVSLGMALYSALFIRVSEQKWRQREFWYKTEKQELLVELEAARVNAKKLAELHNSSMQEMQAIRERLSTLELKIAGYAAGKRI